MAISSEKKKSVLRQLLLVGILAGAALPVSMVAVFVGRGSVEHFVIAVVPALLGAPLLALWGIVIWFFASRNDDPVVKRRMRWMAAALVGIGHFFLLLAPSYPAGLLMNYRDIRGARFYCESLMPRLESYREANGVYPAVVATRSPVATTAQRKAVLPLCRCRL